MWANIEFSFADRFSHIMYLSAILMLLRVLGLSMCASIVASRLVYRRMMGRIVTQFLCAFMLGTGATIMGSI